MLLVYFSAWEFSPMLVTPLSFNLLCLRFSSVCFSQDLVSDPLVQEVESIQAAGL